MPQHVAVIDLGSNAVRFEVYDLLPSGSQLIHRERKVLRLGNGVFEKRRLDPQSVQAAFEFFADCRKVLDELSVARINAVATSALREASDGEDFLRTLTADFGITFRIISGLEEAQLIAKGILSNESGLNGTSLLIDIGGGSTELSRCEGGCVVAAQSVPIGAIRCHQSFLKSNPPAQQGIASLREYTAEVLCASDPALRAHQFESFVGSSGTVRTIAALGTPTTEIKLDSLNALIERMQPLDFAGLCAIPGMESNRADVALAGAIALSEILTFFGGAALRVSTYSLRHGLLAELSD